MCLYPTLMKNKKYTSTKKNGGVIPAITDERVKYVPIGCGNCMECRKQKSREWQVRLLEDIKKHKNGKFITLTFSNQAIAELDLATNEPPYAVLEGYEKDNAIATIAVRRFLERYRKRYGVSLRHWLITELGHNGTENIHLHGIIWTDKDLNTIEKLWSYGWMWKGKEIGRQEGKPIYKNYVNGSTVNYMVKYMTKVDELHKTYKSKVLTSAGIGGNYIQNLDSKRNKFDGTKTIETYRTDTGHKIAMPIYWRNKIYSEQEREKLWLQRLDKQVRYVNGEKVSIKNGEEAYWKLLQYHQTQNTILGYGTDHQDWSKKEYEKQRRILLIKKRIEQGEKGRTA